MYFMLNIKKKDFLLAWCDTIEIYCQLSKICSDGVIDKDKCAFMVIMVQWRLNVV